MPILSSSRARKVLAPFAARRRWPMAARHGQATWRILGYSNGNGQNRKRRDKLATGLADLLVRLFAGRILPFDRQAATACATIIGRARSTERAIAFADAQIAAIAQTHGFSVATRDTAPFEAAGAPVIDPWRR
jgi:hypothetical protein